MIQNVHNKRVSNSRFLRFFLFAIATFLLLLSFPRKGKFKYEFNLGDTWKHDDFIAPYNFTVYKLEEELEEERDSIIRLTKPYFQLDNQVEINQLALFEFHTDSISDVFFTEKKIAENQKQKLKKFLRQTFDHVYSNGIIESKDILNENKNGDTLLYLIHEPKNTLEKDISEVFTLKTAYQYLLLQLSNYNLTNENNQNYIHELIPQLNVSQFIKVNLLYNKELSNKAQKDKLNNISQTIGMVMAGQIIVMRGEVINKRIFRILTTLKTDYEASIGNSNKYYLVYFGQLIIVLMVILSLYLFLYHFRSDILYNNLNLSLILLLVTTMVSIASFNSYYRFVNFYLIPFVMFPIILRTIYDSRLAHMVNSLALFLLAFIVPNGLDFIFLQFMVSTVSIFSLRILYKRWQLFATAGIVFVSYSFIYLGIILIQEADFSKIPLRSFVWFAGNSLLVLASYPLIYIFEKIFGFLTELRLLELSDLNHPVLRQLADRAPGTFQHSLQVANLAEETIYKIGGNPLLARTGALYHDIGKEQIPMFFIENIRNGNNPHQKFSFEESAAIIISHVSKGLELASKHKLPAQITDFIRSHHGTTKVQYFYRSYMREHPQEPVDEKLFTYNGIKPYSRETAVVMMADCVEAASRSLKEINEQIIEELVDKLINFQIEEQQFDNVNLTFKDINLIKQIFKEKLKSIYHARIEYPKA